MFYLIFTLIVGISFAPLMFPRIDFWHAQGIWTQSLILIIFSYSFFQTPKKLEPRNTELFLLNLWVGGFTAFICFIAQHNGKYDIQHFFPYFNFLCLLILYKAIVQNLNKEDIRRILLGMRYVVIGTLIMSVLQYLGMAQFFKMLDQKNWFHHSPVIGFIGNGTHLSGFLAMTAPLFLEKNRENILILFLMFLVLCLCGTTLRDPAISGFIVIGVVAFYMLVKTWNLRALLLGIASILALIIFILEPNFFSFNGRIEIWEFYAGFFQTFKQMAITGYGPGSVNIIYQDTPFPNARHLHMELFQFAFEIGLLGVGLILALVHKFFKFETPCREALVVKAICIGFLVSCLFNYPAHLWLASTWAMFCYASLVSFNRKENSFAVVY